MTDQTAASETQSQPPRQGRAWGIPIVLVVAVLAGAAGVALWRYCRSRVGTDDASIEMTMVQVAPRVGGRLQQINVDTGDEVRRGQVLARLETDDLTAALRQAQAAVAARRKAVAQAEAALGYQRRAYASEDAGARAALEGTAVRVKQATVAADLQQRQVADELRQARAALEAAEADRQKADADLARFDKLYAQGAVSAQQYDAAVSAAANARAGLKAAQATVALAEAQEAQITIKRQEVAASRTDERQARARLSAAEAAALQVRLREAELAAARAQAQEAEAALRLARIALGDADIVSPADGVVAQKLAEPGEMVSVGQPILTITEHSGPTDRWVIANLEETKVARVRVGQPARFTVDAYPGKVFHGHVIEIRAGTQSEFSLIPAQQPSGSFTKVTQRVPVRISVDDAGGARLAPGMSAVVTIEVGRGGAAARR